MGFQLSFAATLGLILFAPAMPTDQEDWDKVMVEGRPGGLAHLLSAHRIAAERLAGLDLG